MKNLLLHHEKHHLHPSVYKNDVIVLTAALISKMDYLNRKDSTLSLHDLNVLEAPFPLWSSMSTSEASSTIAALFSPLKDRMHYRRRKQGRRLISKFVQQNEDRRKGKQFRALFKSLFNRHTRPLDEVVLPDGSIVSDPRDLLDVLTDHMTQWHQLNTADPSIEWPQLLTNNKYLSERKDQQLLSLQNVPTSLLDAINSAISMHTDNHTLHDTMNDTLNRDINFADFMNEIHRRANNKSPGPSGFTINMLKSLPSSTLQALFDSLNELWTSPDQSILPDSWYTRWLCLIPKDKFGPPNLDRIRPISLFEVIRKVWTSILITRITRVWKDLNILHPAQHGYQPNIGTDTELIQLLNVIKDAQEHSKPLIMTSYDTAKAFDSVNKSFMETA